MKDKKTVFRANRKRWWRNYIKFKRLNKRKEPKFIYLGEEFVDGAIVLCNHEGTNCPRMIEWWFPKDYRFWGAHEMNSGMKNMCRYLRKVFYPQKKKWKKFPSELIGTLGTPITTVVYKGLNLISTYSDLRFKTTIDESIETLKNNLCIILFPEDSTNGYQKHLEGFHPGFVALMEMSIKKLNYDVPLYVMFWHKKENVFVVDKQYSSQELLERFKHNKDDICNFLC